MAVMESNETSTGLQTVTTGPARLIEFLKDTRQEMRKVVTPTRDQVQSTTIVVLVTVFIFAAYFALIDAVAGKGIDKMFLYLTKH
jgi:preprotein translocase subunit SecE